VRFSCQRWSCENDCSGFVKDVAADLGISLKGQANEIVDTIQKKPWTVLKSGAEAKQKAVLGKFVIGGLKDTPHGHVVVVVDGPLAHGKYPTAYWGSLHGIGKKHTTVNWSWNKNDRDKVTYCCVDIG
jgi:hypothetical protein